MRKETYNSSDHTFVIAVPETIDEYDKLANKVGRALENAIDKEVMHGTLGDVREAFCDLIEEDTKVPRREIGTGKFTEGDDGKKVEVTTWEKSSVYITRAAAEKGLDIGKAPFQKLADRLSVGGDKEVKFDPSVHERKSGPAKLAAKWTTSASDFLTGAKNSKGAVYSLLKLVGAIKKDLGKEFVKSGDTAKDITALGWLIKERADKLDEIARQQRDDALAA